MKDIKKIIKHVKGNSDYGLWYPIGTHFPLCVYMDSDYVESMNDPKNISGACYFFGNCLMSWHCKK